MGCQAIGTVRVAIVFPTAWHAPLPIYQVVPPSPLATGQRHKGRLGVQSRCCTSSRGRRQDHLKPPAIA
jgi:hypothetical protein